jgi:hypothetical protein
VHHWEIVPLQDIEFGVIVVWLTMSKRNQEKVRLEFFDRCTFSQNRWDFLLFTLIELSKFHFLWVIAVAKYVVSLQSLALV